MRDYEIISGGRSTRKGNPRRTAWTATTDTAVAHGTADTTVGAGNSRRMAQRLRESGNEVELIEYKGAGHLGIILSLAHGFQANTTLRQDMLRFIRAR